MGNEFLFDIKEICNTKNVLSQNNIKKFRKDFLKFSPNEISEKFSSIPLVSAAIETIACLFKQLDNKKAIEVKQFLIQQLIYSYPYKNYKDHKLLAPYKIIEKPNFIEYTLNGEPVAGTQNKVISKKTETLITKIQLMSFCFSMQYIK
ncbi:hypothetical protein [Rickettsia endosymbiont of Pantilius tunicatus]|uniref:hypothetical protein n=1 Tax=Rickettsia endosymbiont of Pantilius tunicatus TaxID=3066267 RepID=UPI0030E2F7B6